MKTSIVITTIHPQARAIDMFAAGCRDMNWRLILVGDEKTGRFDRPGVSCLSLHEQLAGPWELARAQPTGNYGRKNLGYLEAVSGGADWIVDTDDDNLPYGSFWSEADQKVTGEIVASAGWINPYNYFTDEEIWPRGFPLERVREHLARKARSAELSEATCLIQQGLADRNPDVDAVYRLTRRLPVSFEPSPPIILRPGCWAPFNSQNTRFHSSVAELLYLPSHCSFRMTDIWRGLVAQRLLWEIPSSLCFHGATVWQDRNEHDIMLDFTDEVIGYKLLEKIQSGLAGLHLAPGAGGLAANLLKCYELLVRAEAVGPAEMGLLRIWCSELTKARRARGGLPRENKAGFIRAQSES